jgi:hypothetical protein
MQTVICGEDCRGHQARGHKVTLSGACTCRWIGKFNRHTILVGRHVDELSAAPILPELLYLFFQNKSDVDVKSYFVESSVKELNPGTAGGRSNFVFKRPSLKAASSGDDRCQP